MDLVAVVLLLVWLWNQYWRLATAAEVGNGGISGGWLTMAAEAERSTTKMVTTTTEIPCVLKNFAECQSLCDESLAGAAYVEGIILFGDAADFSYLLHQTNIKWVQLTRPASCKRHEWFHGKINGMYFCYAEAFAEEHQKKMGVMSTTMASSINNATKSSTIGLESSSTNTHFEQVTQEDLGDKNQTESVSTTVIIPTETSKQSGMEATMVLGGVLILGGLGVGWLCALGLYCLRHWRPSNRHQALRDDRHLAMTTFTDNPLFRGLDQDSTTGLVNQNAEEHGGCQP